MFEAINRLPANGFRPLSESSLSRGGDTDPEISAAHGASSLVAQALRQLEQEGLVVFYPYRGTEVYGVSQEEVEQESVPLRLILECIAFRHALPKLTEAVLDDLADIVAAMGSVAEEGDFERHAVDDLRFHKLLIAKAEQSHCQQSGKPSSCAYTRISM